MATKMGQNILLQSILVKLVKVKTYHLNEPLPSVIFTAVGAVVKIGFSLKPNHHKQINPSEAFSNL